MDKHYRLKKRKFNERKRGGRRQTDIRTKGDRGTERKQADRQRRELQEEAKIRKEEDYDG